jgi:hypothetical protein
VPPGGSLCDRRSAAAAAAAQPPPRPPTERREGFVWKFEKYKDEAPPPTLPAAEEQEVAAAPEPPQKRRRVAPQRRPLPWELWAPKAAEDFVGNRAAREDAAKWLQEHRWQGGRRTPVATAMLLLYGESGTGKSYTAEWLLRSKGYAVCRFDSLSSDDLGRFLRRVVATDLGGKRSAILLDEVDELFAAAPEAARVVTQCVVVATANAPSLKLRQEAAKAIRFFRPHLQQARRLLGAMRPELSLAWRATLATAACGDYRQLALHAALAKPEVTGTDVFRTPFDVAKDALCSRGGGGSVSEAHPCGFSCDVIRWNFAACGNDLAACATFQADCCAMEAWPSNEEAGDGRPPSGFALDAAFMVPFMARARSGRSRPRDAYLEEPPRRLWQAPAPELLAADQAALAALGKVDAAAAERLARLQRAGAARRRQRAFAAT